MKRKSAFHLDTALATWRHTLSHERFLEDEDLDELEGHVREQVDYLKAKGYTEEKAFYEAMQSMGGQGETLAAYKSVYWGKLKRKQTRWDEIKLQSELVANYMRVAVRTFLKQRNYALINILGLSAGLTCFLLIGLFVHFEVSYDRFHEQADHIYRIAKENPGDDYLGSNRWAVTPGPLVNALNDEFPEVERATQLQPVELLIKRDENQFYEDGIYATPQFFEVFSFPLLQGDPANVLAAPNSIVLTESVVRKYTGSDNPIGQSMSVLLQDDGTDREVDLQITGIVADPPTNSHFDFDYVVSMTTQNYYTEYLDHWDNNNYRTYALLATNANVGAFDQKLKVLAQTHLGQMNYYRENPDRISIFFSQPLTDIHLHSKLNGELGNNGDVLYTILFASIGILILLIACINYVNLAMVRANARSKEVGVRKVMGANRGQLIAQFMGESILPTLCALVIATIAAILLLPTFNALTAREISLSLSTHAFLLSILLGVGLGAGLLAGSYPAFVIASYQVGGIFKKQHLTLAGKARLRNVLVTVQFAITIILVVSTLVIRQQLAFTQQERTGVDRDQVVVLSNRNPELHTQYAALKQSLEQHHGIESVTASQDPPTHINSQTNARGWEGAEVGQQLDVFYSTVQYGFLEQFGIELVAGRDFSPSISSDETEAILINETLQRQLGWDSAVGRRFPYRGREAVVIGVMKDFNFLSFKHPVAPLALYLHPTNRYTYENLLIKVNTSDMQVTLAHIEQSMATFSPGYPFLYEFLDQSYNSMYATESRLSKVFGYFTILALFIASMGLLGLAAYIAEGRKKEIGVRKVLGATKTQILMLLSGQFTRLVLIAFALAAPIGYLGLSRWLEGFAYKVPLGWLPFTVAGGLVLVIALATVIYQSMRAALANPVQSLKCE